MLRNVREASLTVRRAFGIAPQAGALVVAAICHWATCSVYNPTVMMIESTAIRANGFSVVPRSRIPGNYVVNLKSLTEEHK